jgi:uncharacterized protein (TIGR00369 family)
MDPKEMLATMPFAVAIGIDITEATRAGVVGTLEWRPDLCTIGSTMHGGALMTLADSVGAVCAFLNLPDGAVGTSTIESKTNMLRAVTEGKVVATATPVHAGRSTIVVQTHVKDSRGKLVALTIQTQSVLHAR